LSRSKEGLQLKSAGQEASAFNQLKCLPDESVVLWLFTKVILYRALSRSIFKKNASHPFQLEILLLDFHLKIARQAMHIFIVFLLFVI